MSIFGGQSRCQNCGAVINQDSTALKLLCDACCMGASGGYRVPVVIVDDDVSATPDAPITDTQLASELTGARLTDLEARMFLRIRADADRVASLTAENATLRADLDNLRRQNDYHAGALENVTRERDELRARLEAAETERDEAAERRDRATDWYQQRFNRLRRWVNEEVRPLSAEVATQYFAICANGSPAPHESADWTDTMHALRLDRDTARAEADSWRKRAEAAEAQLRPLTAPATAPKPTPGDEPTTPAPGSSDPSRTR